MRLVLCILATLILYSCSDEGQAVQFKRKHTGTQDIIYDMDITPDGTLTAVGGYVWSRGLSLTGKVTSDTIMADSFSNKGVFCLLRNRNRELMTVGTDGYLFVKQDNGISWQFHRLSNWDILHNILETNNGYLASGGKSYEHGYIYLLNPDKQIDTAMYFDYEISDIKKTASGRYIAAGWGNVRLSDDGGITWKTLPVKGDFFASCHFDDKNHGWIVGYNGTLLHSADGGNTWFEPDADISANGTNSFRKITGFGKNELMITGNNGRLWRSVDAGKSWTTYKLPTHEDIYDVEKYSGIYYISGSGGLLAGVSL